MGTLKLDTEPFEGETQNKVSVLFQSFSFGALQEVFRLLECSNMSTVVNTVPIADSCGFGQAEIDPLNHFNIEVRPTYSYLGGYGEFAISNFDLVQIEPTSITLESNE
ncbi:MAG TPA: hypothetical protein VHP80_07350, partial [Candidatus Acidoferrum sp.]|nr:hypothetical protein [Candidatus Acidoferrum sp.]